MTNQPERSVEEEKEVEYEHPEIVAVLKKLYKKAYNAGFNTEQGDGYDWSTAYGEIKPVLQAERQKRDEMVEAKLAEYKQFVLNVLDGVDIADGQCNTKAIRLALQSRVITQPPTPLTNKVTGREAE